MKRLLLLLLLLLFSCNKREAKFGDDKIEHVAPTGYWIYLAREDKIAVTNRDNAGQHKKGDIILITKIKDCRQNTPTKTERAFFNVIRVDEISEEDITKYTESFEDTLAYRKYKIDDKNLTIGLDTTLLKWQDTEKLVSGKTKTTLFFYDVKRVSRNWSNKIRRVFKEDAPVYRPFAEVVKTICAVGDNKSDEDYNTLTAWEDANDGDQVTATTQQTAVCYKDDGVLDDAFTIDGSTTNATYYMKVTVVAASKHTGTAGTGFVIDPTATTNVISILDNYTTIEWLEIKDFDNTNKSRGAISSSNANTVIRYNIIWDGASTVTYERPIGIYVADVGLDNLIYNNIVYDIRNSDNTDGEGITTYATVGIYNNTVYDCHGTGIDQGAASANNDNCINNIAYNNGTDFATSFTGSDADYNFSKDDTAPGANSIHGTTDGKTPDFTSTTGGSENFHLLSTSDAIDVGTSISGTFTDDIDGVTRAGTWDMGADEYVAPAVTTKKRGQLIMIMRGRR